MSSYTNSDMESPSDIQNESDEDAPLITKKVESYPESDENAPLITKKLMIPPDLQNESDEDVPLITKKKKTKTKARSKSKSDWSYQGLIEQLEKIIGALSPSMVKMSPMISSSESEIMLSIYFVAMSLENLESKSVMVKSSPLEVTKTEH